MSVSEETRLATQQSLHEINLTTPIDRRSDVEAKQLQIAALLRDIGCDGLLALQPEHFAWLTSGGAARGILDPQAMPALYYTQEGRWLLSCNVDSQRLFDEELDGLGFQLKEWPWQWGRQQLLTDLCQGRKVACDEPFEACVPVGPLMHAMRRNLSEYELACYRALGQVVSHALEATGRTMTPGETEREIAGQISHRLTHRGAYPIVISVAADGRSRTYRQCSFTATPIKQYCVMTVSARKYGLCARASRAVAFGTMEDLFRREHDAACKVSATYVASSWPDSVPRQIFKSIQTIFKITGAEHEFYMAPQGHITGRSPVELMLTPQVEELFRANWAVTWSASVGAAMSCDTFLISEDGPRAITAAESWPLKRIKIHGGEFVRPDVLLRP